MHIDHRGTRVVLGLVTAVCLGAGVVTAVAHDPESPQRSARSGTAASPAAGGGASAESEPGAASAPPTAAGPASETRRPGAGPTSSGPTAVSPPLPGAPGLGDPGPTRPPASGAYRYRLTVDGQPREGRTTVLDRGRSAQETRQAITVDGPDGMLTTEVAWRADGAYLRKTTGVAGAADAECDWEPDTLQLRLPLAAAVAWEADSTCSTILLGQPFKVRRTIRSRVTALERIQVAGEPLQVWVIEEQERIDVTGGSALSPLAMTQEATSTTMFSPLLGLPVRSSSVRGGGPGGDGRTTTVETEILALRPG